MADQEQRKVYFVWRAIRFQTQEVVRLPLGIYSTRDLAKSEAVNRNQGFKMMMATHHVGTPVQVGKDQIMLEPQFPLSQLMSDIGLAGIIHDFAECDVHDGKVIVPKKNIILNG